MLALKILFFISGWLIFIFVPYGVGLFMSKICDIIDETNHFGNWFFGLLMLLGFSLISVLIWMPIDYFVK